VRVYGAMFPDGSVTRTEMVFDPSRRVRFTDHEFVPEARIQVAPFAVTSTFSMAMLSDAVPVKVKLVARPA